MLSVRSAPVPTVSQLGADPPSALRSGFGARNRRGPTAVLVRSGRVRAPASVLNPSASRLTSTPVPGWVGRLLRVRLTSQLTGGAHIPLGPAVINEVASIPDWHVLEFRAEQRTQARRDEARAAGNRTAGNTDQLLLLLLLLLSPARVGRGTVSSTGSSAR